MPDRSQNPETSTDSVEGRPMLELYQAEWCPSSHRIRARLTELGVTYLIRQVPVARADRDELAAATGQRVIPALIPGRGTALVGAVDIVAWLDEHIVEPPGAESHRMQAELLRRREFDFAPTGRTSPDPHAITPLEVVR